jgi:hypothetical protein
MNSNASAARWPLLCVPVSAGEGGCTKGFNLWLEQDSGQPVLLFIFKKKGWSRPKLVLIRGIQRREQLFHTDNSTYFIHRQSYKTVL